MAVETLRSGKALLKLKEIIEAQGGDPKISHTDIKPGEHRGDLLSPADAT